MIKKSRKSKINWGLTLLAIPGTAVLFAIYYIPMFGLVIPFKRIDYSRGIFGSDWISPVFKNFEFFFNSNDAVRITSNTLSMNFCFILITVLVSIGLALLMYQFSARKVKLFQTCMFVPYFISWVVASYVVYALLCPDMGVMSVLCKKLGFSVPNFIILPIIGVLLCLWPICGKMWVI